MTDSPDYQKNLPVEHILEALLFVSPAPVTISQLVGGSGYTQEQVEKGLRNLADKYLMGGGLMLQEHKGRYQLTTKSEMGQIIEQFLGLQATSRLSKAALETLAIIAYKQPVTRPQLDDIRGVNSDGVIKSLLSKGLIEETGRADGPGRPIIYGSTGEFLQYFGLNSLSELPPFDADEEPAEEIKEKVFKD